MDIQTHVLVERACQIREELSRRIAIVGKAGKASTDGKIITMSIAEFVGPHLQLISLIDDLSAVVAQQSAELKEAEDWKSHIRGETCNTIGRMKDFVDKTSAELDDLRRERDDAMTVARLMHVRLEAVLQFKSAMPQHAADRLIPASKIHANLQHSRARRHAPSWRHLLSSPFSTLKLRRTAKRITCVEAGGNWVKKFGPTWNCVRSDSSNFQPGE